MNNTFEKCLSYFESLNISGLDNYEILGVEKEILMSIDNVDFVGYIDLLLRNKSTGDIIVIDHKSSGYPLKQDGSIKSDKIHQFESYKNQMYVYSLGIKKEYGVYPRKIVWNHFKDNKVLEIDFSIEEFKDTMKWCEAKIREIKKDELFNPNTEYFFCNVLCNFRKSCEYKE